jgi:hypothetical protein
VYKITYRRSSGLSPDACARRATGSRRRAGR